MDFEKYKQHIEYMRKYDENYAEWARGNFARILAVFLVKGG